MREFLIYSTENPMPGEVFLKQFAILESSFPRGERRDFDKQRAVLQNPKFRSLTLADGDEVLGFLNYWELEGFTYIEHFAVLHKLRGQGLGSEMIRHICKSCAQPIILEVEPPAQSEIAARRVGFYNRQGLLLNDYYYEQPPYRKGEKSVELKIMSFPDPLSKADFDEKVRILYRNVY